MIYILPTLDCDCTSRSDIFLRLLVALPGFRSKLCLQHFIQHHGQQAFNFSRRVPSAPIRWRAGCNGASDTKKRQGHSARSLVSTVRQNPNTPYVILHFSALYVMLSTQTVTVQIPAVLRLFFFLQPGSESRNMRLGSEILATVSTTGPWMGQKAKRVQGVEERNVLT